MDLKDGEMMVKPTALHPMVSISNQIGALATGPVFLDEGSKKLPLLINTIIVDCYIILLILILLLNIGGGGGRI